MFILTCVIVFILAFAASVLFKLKGGFRKKDEYSVEMTEEVGTLIRDLAYGEDEAQNFDLYLPKDNTRKSYGLVVYLHAGGFTTGDKTDDTKTLAWLCSKGYVAAGINYTLFGEKNPNANVYTQSVEVKNCMPYIMEEAAKHGYNITEMSIGGGSAGCALALIYAYRDKDTSPVPVRMAYGAVGPTSYYPEDWKCFGFDKNPEAGVGLFSVMTGNTITTEMIGTAEYDEAIKNVSPLLWVDKNTVPTVLAYGAHDKMQSFEASARLACALRKNGIDYQYYVAEHSGHGLQNDKKVCFQFLQAVEEYLEKYMPRK